MKDRVDRTVIGAAGGLIGGLAMIFVLRITSFTVYNSHPKIMHVAHLFVPAGQDHTFWGQVLAHIAHLGIGALLGVLYINIFRITGRDWVTTKGLLFGFATWLIIFGILGKMLNLPQQGGVTVAFLMLAGHLTFGIATSWAVFWLSERVKL